MSKCIYCGKEHVFNRDDEPFKNFYCSEECQKAYYIISEYMANLISANDATKELKELGIKTEKPDIVTVLEDISSNVEIIDDVEKDATSSAPKKRRGKEAK